jgi:aminoglycoside 6'-N-acetyltransferase
MPVLSGDRVTLRPLTDADVEPLARILAEPSVRKWWGSIGNPAVLREDLLEGIAFAIEADGSLAGWLAVQEENEPDYRHAAIDIVLATAHQDRGLGSEALRTVIHWLIGERGHHRFTIDPAAHNERAIRAYEAVGFRRVGVLRQYERGEDGAWRDGLLLDLLADELRS